MHAHRLRRGVTLFELLVVVVLMGIFASVAMARFGPTLFGDFGSQSDARRLSLALLQSQRMAIVTGDNHYVQFTIQNGRAIGFQIFRREASGESAADNYQAFSNQVAATVSHSIAEFTFEGQALGAYRITFAGNNRRWTVNVVPVNGAVSVVEG